MKENKNVVSLAYCLKLINYATKPNSLSKYFNYCIEGFILKKNRFVSYNNKSAILKDDTDRGRIFIDEINLPIEKKGFFSLI